PHLQRSRPRHLRDHGRQRLRQEHPPQAHDRARRARAGRRRLRRHELLGRGLQRTRPNAAPTGRALSEWRPLELHDVGREHRPAARGVHGPVQDRDPRGRLAQARARRPRRVRGLLSIRNQRWDAEARGARPRHGPGPGHLVLRRALGRPRPDQLSASRRPDPGIARQPGRDGRDGDARAAEHLRNRQQLGVPRRRDEDDDRGGPSPDPAARLPRTQSSPVSHPGRSGGVGMARKANPALIGAFVVGAIVLAVVALVLFGGGKFFRDTQTLVAYFDGSLKGIAIGAPVTFNGVKVGSVTDVKVVVDERDGTIRTPVFFEVDANRFESVSGSTIKFRKSIPKLKELTERGLRAQLELQSLVTGQLEVALNFYPGSPLRLTGLSKDHPEMPTIQSGLDKLSRTLENLPIDQL